MSEDKRQYRWLDEQERTREPEGFLSRWSRRKVAVRAGVELEPEPEAPVGEADEQVERVPEHPEPLEESERIDPRTGKRYDELTDEDMPPLESLTPNSDVSIFMAKNVSASLRMQALSRVFSNSRYNEYCICAEYAEDYNSFAPLGDIVPHDLKAAIVREAGKLRDRLLERGQDISLEEAEQRVVAERREGKPVSDLDMEPEQASNGSGDEVNSEQNV